jgi:hypothetical protein
VCVAMISVRRLESSHINRASRRQYEILPVTNAHYQSLTYCYQDLEENLNDK